MSDTQAAEPATQGAAKPTGTSPGAMLRDLRTAAGVELAVLASMVKVTPQKLDALEHDHFEQLPDLTFARGLAAGVCRTLHADPAPILARMPARSQPLHMEAEEAPEVAFRRPGDDPAPLLSGTPAKIVATLVVVLLVGSALVWFWPTAPARIASADATGHEDAPVLPDAPAGNAASGAIAPAAAANAPEEDPHADGAGTATPPAASTTNAPAGTPATGAVAAASAAQSAAVAGSTATTNPAADATSAVAATQPPAAAAGPTADDAAAGAQLLTLKATGESWVGVKDATGKSLLNRTLKSGETVSLDGTPPLAVVLGRKQDVDVLVRGEPFDTQKLGSATVARFQVK